jgi:hypothetical protein
MRDAIANKQTQFPAACISYQSTILSSRRFSLRRLRRTNPIGLVGCRPGGRNAQNEPNLSRPHRRSRPLEANDAKQSQFGRVSGGDAQPTKSQLCKTKPNLSKLRYLGDGASGRPIVRNKPNLLPAGRISHHSSILSFHHSKPMSIVRDKANLEEVSSVKCQVLSQASRAASLRDLPISNFTLGSQTQNSAFGALSDFRRNAGCPLARTGPWVGFDLEGMAAGRIMRPIPDAQRRCGKSYA